MLTDKQIEALKKLANSSALHKAVFEVFATRERPRAVSDLRRLRHAVYHEKSVSIRTDEFLALFKTLEQMGLGKLQLAKRDTDPHRFAWKTEINYKELGGAATGIEYKSPAIPSKPLAEAFAVSYPHMLAPFPLRGGAMPIAVPSDFFTKDEADRLSTFIRMYTKP